MAKALKYSIIHELSTSTATEMRKVMNDDISYLRVNIVKEDSWGLLILIQTQNVDGMSELKTMHF